MLLVSTVTAPEKRVPGKELLPGTGAKMKWGL
jgi:hypothetical protein